MIPAASGAEAEVPVCDSVHFCRKSVVTCQQNNGVGSVLSGGDQRGGLPVLPVPTDPKHHGGVVSQGQDTWVPVAALLWIGQCLALSKPQFPKEQED